MQTLLEIFNSGGFVMYPLLICSLITWAVALERLWAYKSYTRDSKELHARLQDLITSGNRERAIELCKQSETPIARVFEKLLKTKASDQVVQKAVRLRLELAQEYKKHLWTLGTIGSATPFLGLFGTVVGILRAFKRISDSGDTGFTVVAGDISEALIATAAGIIVAVIAVAFYNYLQQRVQRLMLESRLAIEEFLDPTTADTAK